MSKSSDAHPMNDYKAQIETILLDATGGDIAMHALDQATASLLQLLNEVRAEERKEVAKLMKQGLAELKAQKGQE